eukprot:TRINITY_DN5726_c1_g1_i2.p1 TRINITY_DN5726_c1_g1~~TRINITY_DN5726_c1_g1_i2.p1  ORF type:complete len:202 (+),score=36.85 TRINITY_DN5726_c1_g1_i2:495-1100(+)
MKKLVKLSLEHKDDLAISTHITALYRKLGNMISGGVAELSLIVRSGSDSVTGEIALLTEWSNSQLLTLKQSYMNTYKNLSVEVQNKLDSFHISFLPYLDYVSDMYRYYVDVKNVGLTKEKIEDDLRSIARRAAYHDYPVLGYTADGAWNILSDSSKPLSSRLRSAVLFFFVTLFLVIKALVKRLTPWRSNHTSRAASGSQS